MTDAVINDYLYLTNPDSRSAGESKTTAQLQSPTGPTGIYSAWSDDDWDFGTDSDYPTLKYTSECSEADDSSLPVCGTALPDQYADLQDLAFSDEVLQVSPPFTPPIRDYQVTLKARATKFHVTLTDINGSTSYGITNTVIDESSDSMIRVSVEVSVDSGNESDPIEVDQGRLNKITISETNNSASLVYTFNARHHPHLDSPVDVDGDGLIEVSNFRDLNAMRYQLDGRGARASTASEKITTGCPSVTGCIGYELAADIDLVGIEWEPIAASENSGVNPGVHFKAIFDGNRDSGYEISNLTINRPNTDAIGLFAYLESAAEVRNLVLSDAAINGRAKVGSLAGHSKGTVTNSQVNASLNGNADVGSLVGHNTGRIINSSAAANIVGNTNVGGLVGISEGSERREGRIINSHASGRVSGENAVGGLAGRNDNFAAIRNSYAVSEVSANVAVGGLVGLNFGTLENTYAIGNVNAREQGGGLVGNNRDAVINSYAISRVHGVSDTGSLIGLGSEGVNNSYWDSSISGQLQGAGGLGKTTAQLQSPTGPTGIYSAWLASDWDFGTATQYPQLRYASGSNTDMPACETPPPDDPAMPNCGDVQVYGLINLEAAGLAMLPQFEPSRLRYAVAVEQGVVTLLSIIARSADSNAEITISYNEQRIAAESGMPSAPVLLDPTTLEAIRIKVQNTQSITEYVLELDYFSSDFGRLADTDGDGLIEITVLEDLNAIRHSLDGKAYRVQLSDGTFTQTVAGCPTTATVTACSGYELTRDLDFADAASYRSGIVNSEWMTRWDPIGGVFNANFNGNGYTLRNLHINDIGTKNNIGLFHTIGAAGRVENLNIRNVTIEGQRNSDKIGSLAGENRGVIFNSRIINTDIEGAGNATLGATHIGGLVGVNDGSDANIGNIEHSAVYGSVRARNSNANNHHVGGLVGRNQNGAEIHNSYAVGNLDAGCHAGGLAGQQFTSTIKNSYADIDISLAASASCSSGSAKSGAGLVAVNTNSDIVNSYALLRIPSHSDIHGLTDSGNTENSYWDSDLYRRTAGVGLGQRSTTLQASTTATGTIYEAWSDDHWDFGTNTQYPTLRATDGSIATEIWDASLLENITAENVAIAEDFAPLKFNYKLVVDGLQPPPQITFNITTRNNVNIEIYCDGVRCPLADPADPTTMTILFATTDLEEIRIVARQSNRVSEYYYAIVYDELTLTNVEVISVNEGDTFEVNDQFSARTLAERTWEWQQIAGVPITINTNPQGLLELQPQADLVPKDADHSIVKFRLELRLNGQVYITRNLSARINKVNDGNNVTIALRRQGMMLQAESTVGDDPDGGSGDASNIIIQRRLNSEQGWAIVLSSPHSDSYNLPAETSDYQYRAIHIYEDAQGYLESIASNIVTIPGRPASETFDSNDIDGDLILNADDIDDDNDGLIEIHSVHDLNRMRYQLDGRGYKESPSAELITRGCPVSGCIGYELIRDLSLTSAPWNVGGLQLFYLSRFRGWQPIGTVRNPFNAHFKGNGHKLSRMQINRSVDDRINIGLFAVIGPNGRVEGLV